MNTPWIEILRLLLLLRANENQFARKSGGKGKIYYRRRDLPLPE